MNWTEALSYCREHHTDLASIRNLDENQKVNNTIPKDRVWIGLYRDTWKWADANNSTFRNWNKENNKPNSYGEKECAAANFGRSGQWEDWNCGERKAFICYSVLCSSASNPVRKYFFVEELKNWTEAQSYCKGNYSNLAVLESMEDVKTLNNLVASLGKNSIAWIGLYNDVNSWKWSDSASDTQQRDQNEFTNWANNEPNNLGGKENCVQIYSDGSWNDEPCFQELSSVCSDIEGTDVKFVYISLEMNWTEAQSYCSEHYTGLAYVRNIEENQKVKKLIPAGQKTWIGLHKFLWIWVDGSQSSFRHWGSGEPSAADKLCAIANLGNSGQWEELGCDELRPFVCYKGTPRAKAPRSGQGVRLPVPAHREPQGRPKSRKAARRLTARRADCSPGATTPPSSPRAAQSQSEANHAAPPPDEARAAQSSAPAARTSLQRVAEAAPPPQPPDVRRLEPLQPPPAPQPHPPRSGGTKQLHHASE
ncbi:C-type mannose receptor 2-like [Cyprinodon tularosa]|uniref:C-type mannose receptor 2-like n=1 Tax=Cyprinodon tularosa TaxID=77115 RepID=UPI0018E26730|nr:C-type mannose receptor 2-like [Cyprinodon tularosa]